MPTINKIRIVNFAYNDDKRLIIDETFEYHGKNGLMNLLNGGGKTVLIQAIMQPFIPLAKLGKREFEELFRKDKEPVYILVEWKLDNNNGYMTNGIAIKRNSHSHDDESTDKIDYFTFILEGTKSKTNITNLKLSNKLNDKITFTHFSEVKNTIKSSGGTTYEKNSDAYKKALNSFRIDTKEWRNIIAKINSEEGGLLKLFENCKTSSALMREWILKSIKENLSDSTNMPGLLDRTEKHIIQSRESIEDKEKRRDLIKYADDISNINMELFKLKDINDKIMEAKVNLSNLLYTLNTHIEEKKLEEGIIALDINDINERLGQIKIEELSSQYYFELDDKTKLEQSKLEFETKLEKAREENEKLERVIRSLEAANLRGQKLKEEKSLEDINTKLSKLTKEQSEIDKELEDLGFTIRSLYDQKINSLKEIVTKNEKSLKERKLELESLEYRMKSVTTEKENLLKDRSSNETRTSTLDCEIENLFNEIDPLNIMLKIDGNEVTKEKAFLCNKLSDLNSQIDKAIEEKKKLKQDIVNNTTLIQETIESMGKINIDITTKTNLLDAFNNELSKINSRLTLFDINDFSISKKDRVISHLNNKVAILAKYISDNGVEVIRKKEILEKLSSSGIRINNEFINYLKDKGIQPILGADYIKESIPTEELRLEIIDKNPLLPFAIILDKASIEYIQENIPEMHADSPIIIIERETLVHIKLSDSKGYTLINENIGVLALYNKELVIKKDIEEEKNKIISTISRLEEENKNWDNQRIKIGQLSDLIDGFIYEEDYDVLLNEQIIELKQKAQVKREIQAQLNYDNKLLENKIQEKESHLTSLNDAVRNHEALIDKCDKLYKYIDARKDLSAKLEVIKINQNLVEKEEKELTERTKELRTKNEDMNVTITTDKGKVKSEAVKQEQYLRYNTGNVVDGKLEILEQRYRSLKSKTDSSSIDEYKERLVKIKKEINRLKEELEEYEDYDIIEYDAERRKETKRKLKEVSDTIESYVGEVAVLKNNIGKKKDAMDDIIGKLGTNELKSRGDIGSNLDQEKIYLKNKLQELNENIIKVKREITECELILTRLDDSTLLEGFVNVEPSIYVEEFVSNRKHIFDKNNKELNKLKKEEFEFKNLIKEQFDNLYNNHSGKNDTIDKITKVLRNLTSNSNNITFELHEFIKTRIEVINRMIDKIKEDLSSLEKAEKQLINNYLDAAKQYTEEINKIDKNSTITIQGKKLKMMKIKNIKDDESSPINLTNYIVEQLEMLTNNIEVENNDLVKAINREFDIETLLVHYCRLNYVRIDFLKIEDNIFLSKDRPWEEVTTNNSGGEKFVSYFVLFSTLINYERKNHLHKEVVSMCLIMDNPFAAISSKHLLIPLFEYAKKNNIQLICFTDHNKADIMDRFDVIHKLVIKTLVNNKEFISSEKIKDDFEVMNDGYYYYNEQISLID